MRLLLSIVFVLASLSITSSSVANTTLAHYGGGYHVHKYYVCYHHKHLSRNHIGQVIVKYRGCFRSRVSCHRQNAKHFGRYSYPGAAASALQRCRYNTPRFVD